MLKLILQLFLFVLTLTLKEEKFPQTEQMSALVLHFCKKNNKNNFHQVMNVQSFIIGKPNSIVYLLQTN